MKKKSNSFSLLVLFFLALTIQVKAQFVHPGGVHSIEDLDRMKYMVNYSASPWIDGYNLMILDGKAQSTYQANPSTSVGGKDGTRQRAQRDATAAYYNILQWYITGDTDHADCAVNILNAWSNTVNKVVDGELFMLPITIFVQAAEITRLYSGWSSSDIDKFKNMCLNYFYPACHNFLYECGSWSGWDGPANASILYIGVFCDDQAKFNEAVDYYKNGTGGGAIMEMISQPSGQVAEMGRDQPHAEIGPGCAAEFCQTAWNQGIDLFGYSDNRLLAGFEYFCKFNLNHDVEWIPYNDCKNNNFYYPALLWDHRISNNPQLEIAYNHYVVRKGLNAPYLTAMLNLRGIAATTGEYAGYNSLTYTLSSINSPFKSLSVPPSPTNVVAKAGISKVEVSWTVPGGDVTSGFVVQRSTDGSSFSTIKTINYETTSKYIDENVSSGTTYYYRIASTNRAGTSGFSPITSAVIPVSGSTSLGSAWTMADIGQVATTGNAIFDVVNNNSYKVTASGSSFGGKSDSHGFLYAQVTGDCTLTVRLYDADLSGTNADRVGIVMRETLNSDAVMASIGLHDAGFRKVWSAHRTTQGKGASWVPGNTHTWSPVWFRISRSGDTFTTYQSQDGNTWFEVGSSTISMSSSYYAGIFVCASSSTSGVVTSAYFDNVTDIAGCDPSVITPYLQVDTNAWQQASSVTIDEGSRVKFGPQPKEGTWSWSGCGTSGTAREQTVTPTDNCTAIATYTNLCGTQSTHNFDITVNKSTSGIISGTYQVQNRSTGMFIDGLGLTSPGSVCGQSKSSKTNNQKWVIEYVDGIHVKIKNVGSGLYIDGGGNTNNGSDALLYPDGANYNKQWEPENTGSYYRFKNRATGLYLDGLGNNGNGSNLGQWGNTNSYKQQWLLTSLKGTSQAEDISPMDIKVYPNPVFQELNIVFTSSEKGVVEIYGCTGELMRSLDFEGDMVNLNISDFSSGIYILRVHKRDKTYSSIISKK